MARRNRKQRDLGFDKFTGFRDGGCWLISVSKKIFDNLNIDVRNVISAGLFPVLPW